MKKHYDLSAMSQIVKVVGWLWILNFAVYALVATWLGGDAINGHAEAGRYYLALHGHSTEVSRDIFEYSRWHTYFLFAHLGAVFVLWRIDRNQAKTVP
jgi:hypothetical protein